jgi:hypothetical protein
LKLHINIPDNLVNRQLLAQKDIPSVCLIGTTFEVHLQAPLTKAVGTVQDWDRQSIEDRAPAVAGGNWTHHRNSLITLRAVSAGVYEILDLAVFYEAHGWLKILADGAYAPPQDLWDEE